MADRRPGSVMTDLLRLVGAQSTATTTIAEGLEHQQADPQPGARAVDGVRVLLGSDLPGAGGAILRAGLGEPGRRVDHGRDVTVGGRREHDVLDTEVGQGVRDVGVGAGDQGCRPIRELAHRDRMLGPCSSWPRGAAVADQLEAQAAVAEEAGHLRTAGQKYLRAAGYLAQAERMQSAKDPAPERGLPALRGPARQGDGVGGPRHDPGRGSVRRRPVAGVLHRRVRRRAGP